MQKILDYTHTHTHRHKTVRTNKLAKLQDTKSTHTKKSAAVLYTNKEQCEKEIKKTIPPTTASKRIKYLEINQGSKDLYNENYKTLPKEIRHK